MIISSKKQNGRDEGFVRQRLITDPNSTIRFKFQVKTPFFNIYVIIHLGKGHIQAINRHSGPDGV